MSEEKNVAASGRGVSNVMWNEDLAAVPREDRTWGTYSYVALWVRLGISIPTYMLASGLIAAGMTWKEALGTILLGNVLVLMPMVLNGHAGAKYGIPFPVYLRSSFGVLGGHVPGMLRDLVACGWFGIQCWIGGEAIFRAMKLLVPAVGDGASWWCFAAFWLLNMALLWRGAAAVQSLQAMGTWFLLIAGIALLFWMVGEVGGFRVLWQDGGLPRAMPSEKMRPDFWRLFLPSLTAVTGFWAIVALSIGDTTRFARSQNAQMVGQAVGLPAAVTLYSFIGIAVTTATVIATPSHRAIWNPMELVAGFHQPLVALAGLAAILVATLNGNLAARIVSGPNEFSALRPNLISSRAGRVIAGALGLAWMPWRLMADPETYIHGWLVGCSGLVGPIVGILLADYFVLRGRSLNVSELYVRDGAYEYRNGFNWRALVALASGLTVELIGWLVPRLHLLYQSAGFVGFVLAGLVYLALMSGPDVGAMIPPTPLLLPVDGFEAESPMA